MKTVMKMREEGCMEICKEEASGSGNQQFSFEIGHASGQSVSDTVFRKTQQKAANALKVVANLPQNDAKRRKTQQMHSRLSPIHRKMPQKIKLHKGFWESG